MSAIRVLHIAPMGKIGGIESRLIDLFEQSIPGFEFFLFSPAKIPKRWVWILQHLRVPFYQAMNESLWEKELLHHVKALKIDIAHFHQPFVKAILALKEENVKVIYHDHGAAWYGTNADNKEKAANLSQADGIIAVSQASKIMVRERFNCPDKLITVIYNGIDFKKLASGKAIPKPKGKVVVATTCRLTPFKGVASLIKAYPDIYKYRKDVVLWIIGHGPERVNLEALTNQLGFPNQIRFWGFQNGVGGFLKATDLYVLPSYREPLAGSLIEAGYMGKPSIASNVDGNPEIILHNKTGILIEPTLPVQMRNPRNFPSFVVDRQTNRLRQPLELDPMEISKAVLKLLSHRARSRQMGSMARRRSKEYFNVNRYRRELSKYYRSILGRVEN